MGTRVRVQILRDELTKCESTWIHCYYQFHESFDDLFIFRVFDLYQHVFYDLAQYEAVMGGGAGDGMAA